LYFSADYDVDLFILESQQLIFNLDDSERGCVMGKNFALFKTSFI
jgi:hypothetical protein